MPPAAQFALDEAYEYNYDGSFDVGAIEVEAVTFEMQQAVVTRISMFPRAESTSGSEGYPSKAAKYTTKTGNETSYLSDNTTRCLADSFDSADEINEISNETKLVKSIARKASILSYNIEGGLKDGPIMQEGPILNETEARYLDILDRHLDATEPESVVFGDFDPDDPHPSKTRGNIEQIMDHFIDNACCECSDGLTEPLKSSLRPSRWGHDKRAASTVPADFEHAGSSGKTVGFKNVDIREFKMTLGNHPSATSGPPVMLDWETNPKENVVDLENYERGRRPRRNRRQLKLSLQQRHNILVKEQGFAFNEVKNAWQEALEIRKQRKETLERGLALMKFDEVWESTCRKFSRLVDGSI